MDVDFAPSSTGLSQERAIFVPDLIDEAEVTVCRIQENFKVMRSRQERWVSQETSTIGL
jgi:hypothetical protein